MWSKCKFSKALDWIELRDNGMWFKFEGAVKWPYGGCCMLKFPF